MKRTIFQYRTGTFYNQKYAVRLIRSTSLICPLPECHHMDSALHVLSGCQCPVIRNTQEQHPTQCEDTRPGQQLETAQQQHADICKNISGRAVTLSPFSLVGRVTLSISLTSLNNWDLTTNVPLSLLTNFMPILLDVPTNLLGGLTLLHHKPTEQIVLTGIWRVTGSTLLQLSCPCRQEDGMERKEKKNLKSTLAKRPHALRNGSLTSKLARVSPKWMAYAVFFYFLSFVSLAFFWPGCNKCDWHTVQEHIILDCPSQDSTNLRAQFQHLFNSATPSSATHLRDFMDQADVLGLANLCTSLLQLSCPCRQPFACLLHVSFDSRLLKNELGPKAIAQSPDPTQPETLSGHKRKHQIDHAFLHSKESNVELSAATNV
eukprot:1151680-Pelagomonas_calceolata.AAC.4